MLIAIVLLWVATGTAEKIVAGARAQLVNPARYDASYQRIGYPNGDVAKDRGACTDVVVRAFRLAAYDLQVLVHKDRNLRGLATDTNIDHRRVKNLADFFKRKGKSLPLSLDANGNWKKGDVVCWTLDNGLDHVGIVTDSVGGSGNLMVVHNISTTKEEDVLGKWKVVGHYRFE